MNLKEELDGLLAQESLDETQKARVEELKNLIAEEEVQKKIQAEADRVRGKYSKEMKELQAKLEALENAKMSDEERLVKEKAEKESLLAEREAQLLKKELDFETMSLLNAKKLDKSFLTFLTGNTIEDRIEQLGALETHINNQIQEAVKAKLGQDPAPSNGTNKSLKVSKEDFKKMGYAEKSNLFLTDPELYNTLKNM